MTLCRLVPVLAFIALPLAAEEVGSLTIGGFADASGHAIDADQLADGADHFAANVELRLGYAIDEKVGAQVDVEWNNVDPELYLEQAYVTYAVTDRVGLMIGKATTYCGWESADQDGLYRVNYGPYASIYGGELIGVTTSIQVREDFNIGIILANGLDVIAELAGSDDSTGNVDGRLGFAIDAIYDVADLGSFNLEFGYDYLGDGVSQTGDSAAEIMLAANATVKAAQYPALTVGAEVIYRQVSDHRADYLGVYTGPNLIASDGDGTSVLGATLLANHTIPDFAVFKFPKSATLSFATAMSDVEAAGLQPMLYEIAGALLTNPTGSEYFGFNGEIGMVQVDTDIVGADTDTTFTASVELIATIP